MTSGSIALRISPARRSIRDLPYDDVKWSFPARADVNWKVHIAKCKGIVMERVND
jgi:hypothetical protein